MRVRDHIVLSTGTAALAWRFGSRQAPGLWAGGVLIDADHYAWYCLRERELDPRAAVRFFQLATVPQGRWARVLHSWLALAAIMAVSRQRPALRPFAFGMTLHVGLDRVYEWCMDRARAVALERDRFVCRGCDRRTPDVVAHLWRQPPVLPDFGPGNLVALCGDCHELAHTGSGERLWTT